MSDQDRIRLAEAMGWENPHKWRWQKPDADDYRNEPPDPFTDANDCEALIQWLNEQGYGLTIEPWANGHSVAIYSNTQTMNEDTEFVASWAGDDWKQGVCELALKVIDDD